jgi:hypothetical protein
MKIFALFFALQFTLYLLVTVNFRAIPQARYGWTILTYTLISAAQFWIIRKVGTSADTSLSSWLGFVFGVGAGSATGIWLSKKVFRNKSSSVRGDDANHKTPGPTWRTALRAKFFAIVSWMQTASGAATATWVQTFAVLISLAFIGYQVQQQTKLSRAANVQTSVGLITPLNLKLTEPDMAQIWRDGSEGFNAAAAAGPGAVKSDQYETLLATFLVFYENAFWQHREGLLADAIYDGWDTDLKSFIKDQRVKDYWTSKRRAKYQPEFRAHVDAIILEQAQQPGP